MLHYTVLFQTNTRKTRGGDAIFTCPIKEPGKRSV